ncbi:MAG: anthranilate synthase component I family protein [Planctomycetales bacterium]|nr:anthranilate synthase component I family protein [Planctomycetales bacterium]
MPDRFQKHRLTAAPPVVRAIDPSLRASDLFAALGGLTGRVWLDSATADASPAGPDVDGVVKQLSRYSFLTADPIHRLVASRHQPNPWPELSRLFKALTRISPPRDPVQPALPPFQGGLVGIIGYEAARWLEPDELNDCDSRQHDDLPTPAMSFGVYDWVIAIDHVENRTWLVCQGFTADDLNGDTHCRSTDSSPEQNFQQRSRRATARADQIDDLIWKSLNATTNDSIPQQSNRDCTGSPKSIDPERQNVSSNFTSAQFQTAVAEIVRRICNGDSFQVNLAQRLTTTSSIAPATLYERLRNSNPAPFAGFYDGGSFQVISSSPEGFLQIRDRHVETRPIKGTVPRTGDNAYDARLADKLSASEKDRAENIMIVDLMRNDLSRVCTDQSVVVSQLCAIERFQFVQHLVSVVEGELGDDVDAVDALMACFPGGSVTGAPKIEAMKTIANLEPHPRGPYCGSMGYLSCSGDADFNILIRTITATEGKLQIPVGGGITARSQPAAEEAETWAKARGMLNALPGENVSENNLPDTNAPAPKENKTAMSPVPRDKISGLA